jgi:hypothetical protein
MNHEMTGDQYERVLRNRIPVGRFAPDRRW